MQFDKAQIEKGLKIGKNSNLVKWGKSLVELRDEAETSNIDENGKLHLHFGEKAIFPNISLSLSAPFGTLREDSDLMLNHLGQNLNSNDVKPLEQNLICLFGDPIEKEDQFGFYRKWSIGNVTVEIIPRSHHGSDWNAIIISNRNI